jgi:hypothetical protein
MSRNPGGGTSKPAAGVKAQRTSSPSADPHNTTRGPAIDAVTEKKTRDALHSHVQQLSDFTLQSSRYNAHGHAEGRQGAKGHEMPPSDAHLQRDGDRIIPQGAFAKVPQTMDTTGSGPGFDESARAANYGMVDDE